MTHNDRKILWRAALRGGDDDLSRCLIDAIGGEPTGRMARAILVIVPALYVAAWRFYAQWLQAGHRFPDDRGGWASFCQPAARWGLMTAAALLLPILAAGRFISKRFWLAWMLPPKLESESGPPDASGPVRSAIWYVGMIVAGSVGGFAGTCMILLIPYVLVSAWGHGFIGGGLWLILLALGLIYGIYCLLAGLVAVGPPASVSVPASGGAFALLAAALQFRLGMEHAFPLSMLALLVVLPCVLVAGAIRAVARPETSPSQIGCFWIGAAPGLRDLTRAMADAAVTFAGGTLARWSRALSEERARGAGDPETYVADLVSRDAQRRFIVRARLLDKGGSAIPALIVPVTDQKYAGTPLRAQCRWLLDRIERETREALGPRANQTICSRCRVHFWQHSFPPDGSSPPVATWYGCRRCGSSTTALPKPARISCRLECPGAPRPKVDPAAEFARVGAVVVPAPNMMPDAVDVVISSSVSDAALLDWLRQAAEVGEVEQSERLANATLTIEGDPGRFSDNALYWLKRRFRGKRLDSRGTVAARRNIQAIAKRAGQRSHINVTRRLLTMGLFFTFLAALIISVICVCGYFASTAYDWLAGGTELRDVQLIAVEPGHRSEEIIVNGGEPPIDRSVDTWVFRVRFKQQDIPDQVDRSDQPDLPKKLNSTLKLKFFNSWLRHDEPNGIDWRASQPD